MSDNKALLNKKKRPCSSLCRWHRFFRADYGQWHRVSVEIGLGSLMLALGIVAATVGDILPFDVFFIVAFLQLVSLAIIKPLPYTILSISSTALVGYNFFNANFWTQMEGNYARTMMLRQIGEMAVKISFSWVMGRTNLEYWKIFGIHLGYLCTSVIGTMKTMEDEVDVTAFETGTLMLVDIAFSLTLLMMIPAMPRPDFNYFVFIRMLLLYAFVDKTLASFSTDTVFIQVRLGFQYVVFLLIFSINMYVKRKFLLTKKSTQEFECEGIEVAPAERESEIKTLQPSKRFSMSAMSQFGGSDLGLTTYRLRSNTGMRARATSHVHVQRLPNKAQPTESDIPEEEDFEGLPESLPDEQPEKGELDKLFEEFMEEMCIKRNARDKMRAMPTGTKWMMLQQEMDRRKNGQGSKEKDHPPYWINILEAGRISLLEGGTGNIKAEDLSELTTVLNGATKSWLTQFSKKDGLALLAELVELSGGNVKPLVLGCMKAILNNDGGLKFILANPAILGVVVHVLNCSDSESSKFGHRKAAIEVLSVVVWVSEEGWDQVNLALLDFSRPFKILVDILTFSADGQLKTAVLAFINLFINAVDELERRVFVRRFFIDLNIQEIIMCLRQDVENGNGVFEDCAIQCDVFESEADNDRRDTMLDNVDLQNPDDLMKAIKQAAVEDGYSIQLINILQHMICIPVARDLADHVWNVLDKIVADATSEGSVDDDDEGDDDELYFRTYDEIKELLKQYQSEREERRDIEENGSKEQQEKIKGQEELIEKMTNDMMQTEGKLMKHQKDIRELKKEMKAMEESAQQELEQVQSQNRTNLEIETKKTKEMEETANTIKGELTTQLDQANDTIKKSEKEINDATDTIKKLTEEQKKNERRNRDPQKFFCNASNGRCSSTTYCR